VPFSNPTHKVDSLDKIREDLTEGDTAESVKKEIDALKDQHVEDLERLLALQAEEYLQEQYDLYLSKDENVRLPEGENNKEVIEAYAQLDVNTPCNLLDALLKEMLIL
jgi:hypothetical protein